MILDHTRLTLKRALARLLVHPLVSRAVQPVVRGVGTIFMLHRFADPRLGNTGHDPDLLRESLAQLRRARRELVSIDEMVRRVGEHDLGATAPVAFTVDDGYADFASVGAPVFTEFDCPVTVFLTTGPLDGSTWFWWDRITAAFEGTSRPSVEITIAGATRTFVLGTSAERAVSAGALMEALKVVPDTERRRVIASLDELLEVALPSLPPSRFAAMTWSDVRRCGANGVTFGAHTVTHPVLSRVDDHGARTEITTSWKRVQEETTAVSRVFCYPNGGASDYTKREVQILAEAGFTAAVNTVQDYAGPTAHGEALYDVPRFPYPDNRIDFLQVVNGVERIKRSLRR